MQQDAINERMALQTVVTPAHVHLMSKFVAGVSTTLILLFVCSYF